MTRANWRVASVMLLVMAPSVATNLRHQAPGQPPPKAVPLKLGPFPGRKTKCPGHGVNAIPPLTLAGPSTNVPEYNDCQRFIINGKYDSLYSVFVATDAELLMERMKRLECSPAVQVIGRVPSGTVTAQSGRAGGAVVSGGTGRGALGRSGGQLSQTGPATRLTTTSAVSLGNFKVTAGVAPDSGYMAVEPNFTALGDCRTKSNTSYNAVGIAFAVIVSWGGEYEPLGIKRNFNCLYLYDSAALKALMVPVDMEESRCAQQIDPTVTEGKHLYVRASSRPGMTLLDYPPVARWDTDSRTGMVFVSIICGAAWCEVGPKPGLSMFMGPSSPYYPSSSPNTTIRRVMEVKGWYDEQRLAEIVDGKPVPTKLLATMFPHPDLDSYDETSFAIGTWLPVARIVVRGDYKKYMLKLNLEATTDLDHANEAFLCKGLMKDCVPNEDDQKQVAKCKSDGRPRMFGKIVSVSGKVRYLCVTRAFHMLKKKIPGTVRWAWFDDDEGGWWRCPDSCCYPGET